MGGNMYIVFFLYHVRLSYSNDVKMKNDFAIIIFFVKRKMLFCPICLEEFMIVHPECYKCYHKYCQDCTWKLMRMSNNTCPICRANILKVHVQINIKLKQDDKKKKILH